MSDPNPSRREFVRTAGAAAALAPITARAADPDPKEPDIWDRTVLPQPFEKRPFREVKVPAWVRDTTGVGYTLSVMNSAQRKAAAEAGVTVSEVGFVDPFYA